MQESNPSAGSAHLLVDPTCTSVGNLEHCMDASCLLYPIREARYVHFKRTADVQIRVAGNNVTLHNCAFPFPPPA